jgi:hypothetical protein
MVARMKTTIEISDPLFEEARAVAREEGTTLKNLVEEGLRLALEERQQRVPFRLRDASVDGKGLQPALRGRPWATIRDLAYEDRGA